MRYFRVRFRQVNQHPLPHRLFPEQKRLTGRPRIWALHDFLSIERHSIEGRFDFRLEGILFVFASLVKDELLQLQELEGLTADKLAKISAMSRF